MKTAGGTKENPEDVDSFKHLKKISFLSVGNDSLLK